MLTALTRTVHAVPAGPRVRLVAAGARAPTHALTHARTHTASRLLAAQSLWGGGGHYVALYQSAFLLFPAPADLMRMAVRQGKHGAHLSAPLKAASGES